MSIHIYIPYNNHLSIHIYPLQKSFVKNTNVNDIVLSCHHHVFT